jgi:hypothetical protein
VPQAIGSKDGARYQSEKKAALNDRLHRHDRQERIKETEFGSDGEEDRHKKQQSNDEKQDIQSEHHAYGKSRYGQGEGSISHFSLPLSQQSNPARKDTQRNASKLFKVNGLAASSFGLTA